MVNRVMTIFGNFDIVTDDMTDGSKLNTAPLAILAIPASFTIKENRMTLNFQHV